MKKITSDILKSHKEKIAYVFNNNRKNLYVALGLLMLGGLLTAGYLYLNDEAIMTSGTAANKVLPIYCVQTDKPQIALTFDAAWGNEDTQQILEILRKHDVKVTFFMTGGWVDAYPDDVKMILAEGHDLGNHSQNHKNMSQISDSEKETELMTVHEKVKELTGYEMFLFRPPYGDYDNAVVSTAKKLGYYTVQWDVDSLDWKDYGVDSIIKTVTEHKHLGNGSIILCHNGAVMLVNAISKTPPTLSVRNPVSIPNGL